MNSSETQFRYLIQRKVRRLAVRWTCSDYANHSHRWKWTAWFCGRLQAMFPFGWYECSLCGHKVRLHRADMKIGCIKDGCYNIRLELRRCKPPVPSSDLSRSATTEKEHHED